MPCNFTFEYTKPKTEMVSKLEAAILGQQGSFQGDETSGEFSFSALGFSFRGNYTVSGDQIAVQVTDKPFLVSCGKIESEIKKYMTADT